MLVSPSGGPEVKLPKFRTPGLHCFLVPCCLRNSVKASIYKSREALELSVLESDPFGCFVLTAWCQLKK